MFRILVWMVEASRRFLAAIEEEIKEPIGEYFDLIAGASTGGILALGLGFRIPTGKIMEFYRDMDPLIFRPLGDLGSKVSFVKYSERSTRTRNYGPRCFAFLLIENLENRGIG